MSIDFNRVASKTLRILRGGHRDSAASVNKARDLRGRFCPSPFTQFDVYENGKAFSCCSAWLPKSLGNVSSAPITDVWNSSSSQAIRKSILDGSFRYCDQKICPRIQADSLPTLDEAKREHRYRAIIENELTRLDELPEFINLCNDASCNLQCPSCRTHRILHNQGREYEKRRHLQNILSEQLFSRPTDRAFRVNITGSGDPFASAVFRDFLFTLDGTDFPNLQIQLQTNGVLLTPANWRRMKKIHANITVVLVSFDAATEATYALTRKGGHWPTLLANVRNLGERRRNGELRYLRLDFVVQRANFREMPDFVRLAKSFGADQCAFSMVLDWGTWSPEQYRMQSVWKNDHPQFTEFLAVLRDPVFDDPMVDLGNLRECRDLALTSSPPPAVAPE